MVEYSRGRAKRMVLPNLTEDVTRTGRVGFRGGYPKL